MSLLQLPSDVLGVVLAHAGVSTLGTFEQLSKQCYELSRTNLAVADFAVKNLFLEPIVTVKSQEGFQYHPKETDTPLVTGHAPECRSVSEYRAKLKKYLLARLCDDLLLASRQKGKRKRGRVPSCRGVTDPVTGQWYFPWKAEQLVIPPDPKEVKICWPMDSEVIMQCGFSVDPQTVKHKLLDTRGVDLEATAKRLSEFLRRFVDNPPLDLLGSIERFKTYVTLCYNRQLKGLPCDGLFPPADVELVWVTAMLHPQLYATTWTVHHSSGGRAFFRDVLSHHTIQFMASEEDPNREDTSNQIKETEKLLATHQSSVQLVMAAGEAAPGSYLDSIHDDGAVSGFRLPEVVRASICFSISPDEVTQTLEWKRGFDWWMRKYRTTQRDVKNQYSVCFVPVDTSSNPVQSVTYHTPGKRARKDPRHQVLEENMLRIAFKEYECFLHSASARVRAYAASLNVGWRNNTRTLSGDVALSPLITDEELSSDEEPSNFKGKSIRLRKTGQDDAAAFNWLTPRFLKSSEMYAELTYAALPFPVPKAAPDSSEFSSGLYPRYQLPENADVPCYLADLMWHSHMLHAFEYEYASRRYVGCFLDHEIEKFSSSPK